MDKVSQAIKNLIDALSANGLDLEDENFLETPERVSKAYKEILCGMSDTDSKIKNLLSKSFPNGGYEGLIISTDIEAYSLCPHHLLPVVYKISVGYMPSKTGRIVGLSKLNRLATILSKRPVLQEKLTKDITNALSIIDPLGVAVLIEGTHFCIKMRGVKSKNSSVITSEMTGAFLEDYSLKEEFYKIVELARIGK